MNDKKTRVTKATLEAEISVLRQVATALCNSGRCTAALFDAVAVSCRAEKKADLVFALDYLKRALKQSTAVFKAGE